MDRKRKIEVFLWAAAIGVFLYLYTYGTRFLNFCYVDWLLPQENGVSGADIVQHYMGWVNFRNSRWHFPIGLIENTVYPNMISIIYTDSVPLFAVVFKLFSSILPDDFQYMGLYGILCFALQGGVAGLILYQYMENRLAAVIGSIFFSSSIIMLLRMYTHTALAAHWIVLLSIYLWKCKETEMTVKKSAISWGILSALTILIQAYFFPMVWGCMFCSMLEAVLLRKSYKRCSIVLTVAAVMTIITGFLFGLFYGSMSVEAGGLGIYSFNLNALWNPLIPSASKIFKVLPVNIGQGEGFAYLGAGAIVLLVFNVLLLIEQIWVKKKNLFTRKSIPIWCFTLGFLVVAVSPIVSFGTHTFSYSVPQVVYKAWSVFRSSGRLIWPIYYMLMIFACVFMFRRFKHKTFVCLGLLSVALCIQLYDQHGYRYETKINFEQRGVNVSRLQSPAWKEISEEYKHIMVYPNTDAIYSNKGGFKVQVFAQENNMTMNIVYLARNVSEEVNKDVYSYFDEVRAGRKPEQWEDTCYVFLDILPSEELGLNFYLLDDIIVGVPYPLKTNAEAFGFEAGDVIIDLVNADNSMRKVILGTGWSIREDVGTWTDGYESNVLFYLVESTEHDVKIVFELRDWIPNAAADLYIEGKLVSRGFLDVENKRMEFILPKEYCEGRVAQLKFRIKNPQSPQNIYGTDDERVLGFFVERILLE